MSADDQSRVTTPEGAQGRPRASAPGNAPGSAQGSAQGSALTSAALSLVELRRHLIRRAGALNVRAQHLRTRGDVVSASHLEEQAARLWTIARRMRGESGSEESGSGES